jgi:hypothetical protein
VGTDEQDVVVAVHGRHHLRRGRAERAASVDLLEAGGLVGGLVGGPVAAGPEAGGGAGLVTVDVPPPEDDRAGCHATGKERRELDWYTRFFERSPDRRVGDEIMWEIDERAWLFIEPNAAQAGAGRITLAVAGLDGLLERLDAGRIEHEPIGTYSNGVRHVKVPDPDGNAIALAEPPEAR